jgi:PKD repeat protein
MGEIIRGVGRRPGRGRIFALLLGLLAMACIAAAPGFAARGHARSHGCSASRHGRHARHRASASRARRHGNRARGCLKVSLEVQGQPGAAGAATSFALSVRPKRSKIRSYKLDFGDGGKSTGKRRLPKSVQHVYRNAGSYTVKLTVKGSHKASAKGRVSVTVPAAGAARSKAPAPAATQPPPSYDPALRKQLDTWLGERPPVGDNREPDNRLTENATLGTVPNLYPGSLVQGDEPDITTGVLKPIPLPPNSGTLTLDGAHLAPASGGSVTQHVTPASAANVAEAVSAMQGQKFNPDSVQSVATDFQVVTSSQEAKLDAKASFSYAGLGKASGFFNEAESTKESHVLFSMREIYYTISYRPDPVPGSPYDDIDAFFAPGTTVADAQACNCMSTEKPPMFVKSVAYGSQFLFMASSTADSRDLKEGLEASVKVGAFGGSGSVSSQQKALLDQTEIKVLAIGGNTNGLGTVISGSLGEGGKGVLEALKKYAQAAIADPSGAQIAQPIFYTLDYIDNTPVGEFSPNPPARTPPASTDLTEYLYLTFNTGDENKDEGDAVRLTLVVPERDGNHVVYDGVPTFKPSPTWNCSVGFCFSATSLSFNENGSITFYLPVSVPVYDIPGSQLTVRDGGHSWHVQTEAAFTVPDVEDPLIAFRSRDNMYFMDDNEDPCHIRQEVAAYTFTMYEVSDPQALNTGSGNACGTH